MTNAQSKVYFDLTDANTPKKIADFYQLDPYHYNTNSDQTKTVSGPMTDKVTASAKFVVKAHEKLNSSEDLIDASGRQSFDIFYVGKTVGVAFITITADQQAEAYKDGTLQNITTGFPATSSSNNYGITQLPTEWETRSIHIIYQIALVICNRTK